MALPAAVVVKNLVSNVIKIPMPARDVLAASTTEIELSEIPEGKTVMLSWR